MKILTQDKQIIEDVGSSVSGSTLAAVSGSSVNIEFASTQASQILINDSRPAANNFVSAVKASVVIQDLTYAADAFGVAGNAITLTYVTGGTAGSETVSVVGTDIEVVIEDGVSTATQIKAAVDAESAAAALVDVSITGTGSNAQAIVASTPLATGRDSTINTTTDIITIPSHGFTTGLEVRLTTTGTLPGGVTTSTDYWVIRVTADTIQLASSLANAAAGTEINLTNDGSGDHTITPEANSVTVKLQESNDIENWVDISSASTTSSTILSTSSAARYMRAVATPTAGVVDVTVILNGKP